MSFNVKITPEFDKSLKQIAKKHKSVKNDILNLINELEEHPTMGTSLGNNLYKVRLALSGTSKGKSGGARVITYVKISRETVVLAQIYLKSEFDTVDESGILKRLSDDGIV
ncbi:type II toxin-antitoxin system RelE/ParE family toxin [uncultured Mucilaginibacter sp.]|uniref:type II toxin-antitoxin system RelE/ParE family toxin n=1 Tax=uncultured Mucilaginibacter sp. TaxID=797541 RepID=UPI0025CFE20D|nr:type II toxin-antitoxin system RelE/ParE family toxin [uncultured Mucilaginibacter sp.]